MKLHPKLFRIACSLLLGILTLAAFLPILVPLLPYGFHQDLSDREAALRQQLVAQAQTYLGTLEGTDEHRAILDIYNAHEPLAQGYQVTPQDDWCATFASAAAIEAGLTHIIPTECGCERQIGLWQALGRWDERDSYLPLPGDYIYYDWDVRTPGNSTGWSDHVGIVVGTCGPFIKVIEGNKDDAVGYRYITRWDFTIRGYGLPQYK